MSGGRDRQVPSPLVTAPLPGRFDPLAWWAVHDPTRIAIVDPARRTSWSYGALDERATRWCAALRGMGVESGDRVAVLARNRVEFVPLLAAANRAGASLVPLNWRLAEAELARILANCTPSVLLGEDRFRGVAEGAVRTAGVREPVWCDLDRDAEAWLARSDRVTAARPAVPARPDDAAMLLYTSGSTGVPKGVVVPHRQLLWNAAATNASWGLSDRDVGPLSTPLFHTGGWGVFTLPLLVCGGRIVFSDAFDPDTLLETMRTEAVTVAFGVPTQLDMLRDRPSWGEPLPALRWFVAGGAPCPPRVLDAVWDAGYRIREGYGLTECGPNCFTTTDALARAHPGTVGHPLQFLETRLTDEDGNPTDEGRAGELQLRGPQLFGGYFNDTERTREVMTEDGWLRTGDLAERRANGLWAIRGRRKEMFISGGENVFPGEVEAALLSCEGVGAACVFGVPDEKWGEVGCAIVVRTPGARAVSEPALVADLKMRLAGYKVPKRLMFVNELPTLGSGKIDRHAAKTLAEASPAGART